MTQLTIRGLNTNVEHALRRHAKKLGTSLNQTVLDILAKALGTKKEKPVYHDLDALAGTWNTEEEAHFNIRLAEQRKIDQALWK